MKSNKPIPGALHRKKKSSLNTFRRSKNIFVISMLAIAIVNFVIFWIGVNFNSILYAFQQRSSGTVKYTLANFELLFREFAKPNSVIMESLLNTMIFFAINLLVIIPLSLMLSYFLYKKIWLFRFFRFVFFMPSIISAVVLTTLFRYILTPNGPIVTLLHQFGIQNAPMFFSDSRYAIWSIVAYCIWTGFGVNLILFNGAMVRIPMSVIESGKIEGVSMFKELVQIIIPMIWPTLSTVLVFTFVGIFTSSGPILLLTEGAFKTNTISYYIFDQVYNRGIIEYSSAVGLFFTVLGLPIVLSVKHIMDKIGSDVEY